MFSGSDGRSPYIFELELMSVSVKKMKELQGTEGLKPSIERARHTFSCSLLKDPQSERALKRM